MTELAEEIYGHYRLEQAIGAGALGTVYRATDQREARTVAVKVLGEAHCADNAFMARLREQAPRWAAVEGANLVPLRDWGEAAGRAYLVSPLLEAGTLRQRFDAAEEWRERPIHAILALLAGAAGGVATLHRAGIIHGNLRPENLFIASGEDDEERLLVADYGLASLTPAERPTAWQSYTAPELAGAQPADRRSDIYALGAILYEALTGARSASVTAAAPPPIPPRTLRPTIPPPVEAIVLRCLASDPDARYRSAAALAADLDASAEELRAATPGVTPPPAVQTESSAITVRADGPTDLALTPGEPQTVAVVVANEGAVATTVALELDGTPPEWATFSATTVQLAPTASERVTLTIDVARDPHNSAGEYPIVLRAVPPEEGTRPATLAMLWTVRPFIEGGLTVQQTATAADTATYSVRLANEGNAPVRRGLAFAASPPLSGTFTPETVDLDPHGEATATLTVAAPRRTLGRARRLPFTVEARSASAPPLTAQGELHQSPRIPLWLPLLGVLILALASGAAIVAAFFPDLMAGIGAPATPAPPPIVAQEVPTAEPTAEPTATVAPPVVATATGRATATTPLALSATSVNFGAVAIGGTAVQNIQVRNATARALTFERIQIDGANAGDFSRAGPCGLTRLDSGLTCPITIIFSPTGGGNRAARLTLTLADGTSQTIDLSGSGTARPSGTPSVAAPTRPVPPLAGARSGQAAALLADGRRLLVLGGRNGANILKSVEIYDLATNTWAGGRDLNEARAGHSATVLPDGKVVVIGGRGGSQILGSAEEYDPATQSWSPFPALTTPREGHTTTVLVDSRTRGYRLLVLGGRGQGGVLDSAEIYDSNTRTWTETPRFLPGGRAGQTATLLKVVEGETPRLMLVGGTTANGEPATAQIIEPLGSAEPRDLPGMPDELVARTEYTATLIEATGEVVFSGGTAGTESVATVTIYNPASAPESAWRTSATPLLNGRAAHTATLLPYGRILLIGGRVGARETTSTELLDPARLATP